MKITTTNTYDMGLVGSYKVTHEPYVDYHSGSMELVHVKIKTGDGDTVAFTLKASVAKVLAHSLITKG